MNTTKLKTEIKYAELALIDLERQMQEVQARKDELIAQLAEAEKAEAKSAKNEKAGVKVLNLKEKTSTQTVYTDASLTVTIGRRLHSSTHIYVMFCDEDGNIEKWSKKDAHSSFYWKDGKKRKFEGLLKQYKVTLTQ